MTHRRADTDIHPQWFIFDPVTETSSGAYTEGAAERTPTHPHQNLIMELIKVHWRLSGTPAIASPAAVSTDEQIQVAAQITDRTQTTIVALNNPNLVAMIHEEIAQIYAEVTESGGAGFSVTLDRETSLNDEDGHGVLSAAPEMFLAVDGNAAGSGTIGVTARLMHRIVRVSQTELLGLLAQFLSN